MKVWFSIVVLNLTVAECLPSSLLGFSRLVVKVTFTRFIEQPCPYSVYKFYLQMYPSGFLNESGRLIGVSAVSAWLFSVIAYYYLLSFRQNQTIEQQLSPLCTRGLSLGRAQMTEKEQRGSKCSWAWSFAAVRIRVDVDPQHSYFIQSFKCLICSGFTSSYCWWCPVVDFWEVGGSFVVAFRLLHQQ